MLYISILSILFNLISYSEYNSKIITSNYYLTEDENELIISYSDNPSSYYVGILYEPSAIYFNENFIVVEKNTIDNPEDRTESKQSFIIEINSRIHYTENIIGGFDDFELELEKKRLNIPNDLTTFKI